MTSDSLSAPRSRPNVLLIMSDQHHKRALGCASGGGIRIETPALDALAARGVRFENAYCNFPLCGPSRMSFLTARHPHEIGCLTNFSQLSSDVPTLAHGFQAAGYETLLSGRMHFVGPDQRHGFERRLIGDVPPTAHIQGGWRLNEVLGPLEGTTSGPASLEKSGPGRSAYQAYDEAVCARTLEWLRERGRAGQSQEARPFFLTVGFVLPHCPFVAPPEDFYRYYERLSARDFPERDPHLHAVHLDLLRRWGLKQPPDAATVRRVSAAYYGLVTFLDRQIGRILDGLAASGLAQDTLVIYTSDHGEQLGEHGLWWKETFYEGSAGVPLIVAPPGGCAPRTVRENVGLMDIGPTVLDYAGAAPIPNASGRSFKHLILGERAGEGGGVSSGWPDEVFAEFTGPGVPPQRMLRSGPWKFNYYYGASPQLFNLEEDPGECTDRAADPACQAVVEKLRARVLDGWDPEAIARQTEELCRAEALAGQQVRQNPPPEPDPLWFEQMPANEIEKIRE